MVRHSLGEIVWERKRGEIVCELVGERLSIELVEERLYSRFVSLLRRDSLGEKEGKIIILII